jgi:hypothetical protein
MAALRSWIVASASASAAWLSLCLAWTVLVAAPRDELRRMHKFAQTATLPVRLLLPEACVDTVNNASVHLTLCFMNHTVQPGLLRHNKACDDICATYAARLSERCRPKHQQHMPPQAPRRRRMTNNTWERVNVTEYDARPKQKKQAQTGLW